MDFNKKYENQEQIRINIYCVFKNQLQGRWGAHVQRLIKRFLNNLNKFQMCFF